MSFESEFEEIFGERIKQDKAFAKRCYAALCNMQYQKGAVLYGCTWRYAGGFIADIRDVGEGYMDFYCAGNEGYVDGEIANDLLEHGWSIVPYPPFDDDQVITVTPSDDISAQILVKIKK